MKRAILTSLLLSCATTEPEYEAKCSYQVEAQLMNGLQVITINLDASCNSEANIDIEASSGGLNLRTYTTLFNVQCPYSAQFTMGFAALDIVAVVSMVSEGRRYNCEKF